MTPAPHAPVGSQHQSLQLQRPGAPRRFGDSLRAGWRNILDCVTRIYSLGLLPGSVIAMEGEDATAANGRLPRPSAARRSNTATSIISRAFSR